MESNKSRTCRSSAYQYKFCEIFIDDKALMAVPDTFNPNAAAVRELQYDLIKVVQRLMKDHLTLNQLMITHRYFFEGKTQQEIADELSIQQSSVHKCIFGNKQYGQYKGITTGGVIKKLKKYCFNDKEALNLIELISDI